MVQLYLQQARKYGDLEHIQTGQSRLERNALEIPERLRACFFPPSYPIVTVIAQLSQGNWKFVFLHRSLRNNPRPFLSLGEIFG